MEIVPRGYVATLEIQSTLMDKIREAQKTDKEIASTKEKMSRGKAKGFRDFVRMSTIPYGLKTVSMYQMIRRLGS